MEEHEFLVEKVSLNEIKISISKPSLFIVKVTTPFYAVQIDSPIFIKIKDIGNELYEIVIIRVGLDFDTVTNKFDLELIRNDGKTVIAISAPPLF
ncbi:hypothetical protein [Bacillus solimangrovi]|uniref:Uncharacterized protein n=1 Tax=Bacillus solimangrovi TaxID=1305675 RepID=A0A1E5LJ25_9BACI|nr:hypothetical protein [Bacillus solimangrovi]OEH94087.1 hypothetical protein BFG57_09580 [Bacillus solimangrovi]